MNTRVKTLSEQIFPSISLTKDFVLMILGAVAVGLLAKVSILGSPVPISFAPQMALFVGAAFGCRRGVAALLTHIGMGVMGLPVFSVGTTMGFARLVGPTGGYLMGYIVAAGLVGYLAERGWDRSLPKAILAIVAGNMVIWTLGCGWLSYCLGSFALGFEKGVAPFVLLDLAKSALLPLLLPTAWWAIKKF